MRGDFDENLHEVHEKERGLYGLFKPIQVQGIFDWSMEQQGKVKVFLMVFLIVAIIAAISAIAVSFIPTAEIPESTKKSTSGSERNNILAYLVLWLIFFIVLLKTIIKKIKSKKENNFRLTDQPVIKGIVGVIVVNALISIAFPNLWKGFYESNAFWLINIGVLIAYHFFSGGDRFGKTVATVTILIVLASLVGNINPLKNYSPTKPIVLQPSFQPDIPMEIALPIIAHCESGGKHFEEDGVTPLKNKEGSSAIGKYQILASVHEERAKSMGFDIRTPEGNEGYAKVLYQESGTKHWEIDPRGRACWEPKLSGQIKGGNMVWKIPVQAPVGTWSEYIPVTGYDYVVNREDPATNVDAEFLMANGKSIKITYPRDAGTNIPGTTRKFRFKSLDEKPATILVTLTPYKAR